MGQERLTNSHKRLGRVQTRHPYQIWGVFFGRIDGFSLPGPSQTVEGSIVHINEDQGIRTRFTYLLE